MLQDNAISSEVDTVQTARVGVIDVGSNSVRLVVFDGPVRAPSYFFNEKVLCGLGSNLAETGRLSVLGRTRAMAAITRFALIAERMELDRVFGVATAAVREARDGSDFVEEVKLRAGLALKVASGAEEGRLAAQGVLMGMPNATGYVVDIGGSSLEMAQIGQGQIGPSVTSRLGPLALAPLSRVDRRARLAEEIAALRTAQPGGVDHLYMVGGSWRALAAIDMVRRSYPLRVLQGYTMSQEDARETAKWIAGQDVATLKEVIASSSARLTLLPLASNVLGRLLDAFEPKQLVISAFGLREGTLYDCMDIATRLTDPLLVAARAQEQASARFPGLGQVLFDWLAPLVRHVSDAERRLIHAATLLHDVHWQAHPDIRRYFAFEAMCRANLAGLNHQGRLFIAAILAQRYKTGVQAVPQDVLALLTKPARDEAARLGRAIRLGAMLTGGSAGALQDTRLELSDARLTLTLGPYARPLFGEVIEKRLARLARDYSVSYVVEMDPP